VTQKQEHSTDKSKYRRQGNNHDPVIEWCVGKVRCEACQTGYDEQTTQNRHG
jgi:hypothetical protein